MKAEKESKEVNEEVPKLQFITTEQFISMRLNNIEEKLDELFKLAKNDTG